MTRTWRCARCGWLCDSDAKKCASCDKGKPRKKKKDPPPVFRPWRCVILALDQANKTGWSVWVLGRLADHGEFDIRKSGGVEETIRVCQIAKTFALQLKVPWVCVTEASWGGYMKPGASSSTGWWQFALRNAQLPFARMCDVYPSMWRARTLPKGMHAAKRDDVRACEVATVRRMLKGRAVGDDEAPAILIGKWATQAGRVGALLPKNQRVTT